MKNVFLVCALLSSFIIAQNSPDITAEEIKQHITYLASDELEGRMTGTDALYEAADFLKKEFESYGLKPLFNGSYFQEFPFMEKLELGDNELTFVTNGTEKSFELSRILQHWDLQTIKKLKEI